MAVRLPSSVGQQNILVYKLPVSSDKKTFLCRSDTCGSVPQADSAKRDRTNPYQSPISNREKVRCLASTYIYSEARDRNPNMRSNLGATQLYPVLALQGLMSYHNSKQTKTTKGWVRQEPEHAYNISHQKAWSHTLPLPPPNPGLNKKPGTQISSEGLLSYSTMPHPNLTFEVHSIEVQLLGEGFDY